MENKMMTNPAKLSGTFICADYCNNWDNAKFEQEMGYLKEVGMEYIVLMSLILHQKNGNCNVGYPTQIESARNFYGKVDVVDRILFYAQKFNIKVFLGLNLDDKWWDLWWDYDKLEAGSSWLFDQMKIGNQMADELYNNYYHKYPRSFYGWYWMWECWNFTIMKIAEPARRQCIKILSDALNISLDHLTDIDSSLPCLISPFVNSELSTSEDLLHMWKDLFKITRFRYGDIFCAQDSCGAGGQKLQDLDRWYSAYRRAVGTKPGLRMWANNENFDQTDWSSMTLDHFIKQLEITDPYVDAHLSFAYTHYYSPGAVHHGFHDAYKYYLENHHLRFEKPRAVTDIKVEHDQIAKKAALSWSHPDPDDIAGCKIFRNGCYIGRVKRGRADSVGNFKEMEFKFKDSEAVCNEEGKLAYQIAAYDFSGNYSRKQCIQVK